MQLNRFDAGIIHFVNQFSQQSWLADHVICGTSDNELMTGGFIMSIFWWAWFRNKDAEERDRQLILSAIVLCTAALFFARALALLLPFRERPLQNPELHFRAPLGVDPNILFGWSSFPSDHAVLFFALATSISFLSRRLGILVFCYAFFIVCLPRIYMGNHYPTDILAGALLGVSIAFLLLVKGLRNCLSSIPMLWLERSPASFYPCFYLITFLFGTMFDPLRSFFSAARHAGHYFMHHHV